MPDPLRLIFDHPEGEHWYWDATAREIEAAIPHDDPHTFEVIISALDNIPVLMKQYSGWQIATGFEFLFNNALSLYPFLFADERIAESDRVLTAGKLFGLFNILFRTTATWTTGPAHLQKVSPADPVQGYINMVCYMFWDNCPLTELGIPAIRAACIDVMERCLAVPNNAVIEGALHGLGHLSPSDRRASEIAASYANRRAGPAELLIYARAASAGHVQ